MPMGRNAGAASLKSKKKEEVTDKIREIKQRQLNWLKQREQSKLSEESNPKPKPGVVSRPAAKLSTRPVVGSAKGASDFVSPSLSSGKDTKKTNIKDKFKNWTETRSQGKNRYGPSKDDTDFIDTASISSGAESELERLVSPELDSRREPVLEENFDNLADQIASRVKEDLGLSKGAHTLSTISSSQYNENIEQEMLSETTWASSRCKTFTKEVPSFNHLGTSGLTSHSCMVCKKLMLSKSHIPMMIIPCGHTLCRSCSDGRQSCPSCECPMVSLTVNIMLQQVIQEYHSHPVPSTIGPDKGKSSKKSEGSANEKQYKAGKYVEDNRRNQLASYKQQLANLHTRHEVLSSEHSALVKRQLQVQGRLEQENHQAQNVRKQEEEVTKAIVELQERLEALKEHRKQYEVQVGELTDEKSEIDGKLTLLTTTMISLSREIEKVKLLAENENDVS